MTGCGFAQKCTKIRVDALRQNQQNGLSKVFITDEVQAIFLSDLVYRPSISSDVRLNFLNFNGVFFCLQKM